MPRNPDGIKRSKPNADNVTAAAEAVLKDGVPVRTAARQFGVSRTTLQRHIEFCRKTSSETTELNCAYFNRCAVWTVFSKDEEHALVQYLVDACNMHYGLSKQQVKKLAFQYAKANEKKYPKSWNVNGEAGDQWYFDFMKRNNKVLSLRKPQPTSLSRATSFNKTNVSYFFAKYQELFSKYKFLPECIYNVDETGITTVHTPGKVIAPKGKKQIGSMTSGERGTNITIICCVNAIGNSVPPMMIFPRVNFKSHMLKGAPPGTVGAAHISGWSNAEKFVEFLKHFIHHVKCSAGNQILLLLDNHESHVSIEAITLAKKHGIVMFTFPPHTSHKLQPLDRGVFGPFKKYYSTACSNWMLMNPGKPISIYDIAENVGKSYPLAFTPVNILAGFRVSGVWPINQNIFTDDEYLSSSVTDRPDPFITCQNNDFPEEERESRMMELNVSVLNSVSCPAELSEPSTSNSSSCTTKFCELPLSSSISCITPEQVRPFPKAKPRISKRGGRKPGRCRILTDTPEKKEIEEQHANRMAKRKRKIMKKSFQIEATSSEELSDTVDSSDSTDDASSTVPDISDAIEKGDFCLTRLQGKKTEHFYVAEIIDVKEERYSVKYLKKIAHSNKFLYDKDVVYEIESNNIVFKLPKPKSVGASERQCMQLTFGISFSHYNVE